ncbi:ethanolamine ammonia-lyase subunit EutC [Caballeronia sp. LZ035]|uniref:ethanolamine ammonia-lyase subunit EutC n=1 Tax=Caballeronia sp. LZ035 TaxID=3038568 RepID=UPI00285FE13B|nr:ethanolamine ammonia-lyase subunit EutC [Caballeronia sp. LZ035]MDR5760684.1 ethanolamine ammonia-lyase subunit EutC [Caballeronia sp. LZ035]
MSVRIDRWEALRRYTDARIALGRTGCSVPTAQLLAFNLAHAQARDAVNEPLDVAALSDEMQQLGLTSVHVRSQASSREIYLSRPDLGRVLDDDSAARLAGLTPDQGTRSDVVFVVADGLSSKAAMHAAPLLRETIARLDGWRIGPAVVATQARVALGDGIGALLGARIVVMLIGERPGLSSPASLGAYVTFDPAPGRNDAQRNCISNIRPEGLKPDVAAYKLAWLLRAAMTRRITGVGLKDDSGSLLEQAASSPSLRKEAD